MNHFVVSDLTEHVGETVVGAVVLLELASESLLVPFGVLGDQVGVLVGGVVLEVGVESITCVGVVSGIRWSGRTSR